MRTKESPDCPVFVLRSLQWIYIYIDIDIHIYIYARIYRVTPRLTQKPVSNCSYGQSGKWVNGCMYCFGSTYLPRVGYLGWNSTGRILVFQQNVALCIYNIVWGVKTVETAILLLNLCVCVCVCVSGG